MKHDIYLIEESFTRTGKNMLRNMDMISCSRLKDQVDRDLVSWYRHNPISGIYFLQASNGNIKIGRSLDVVKRVAQIKNLNATRLTLLAVWPTLGDGSEEETFIHNQFANQRTHSEWFRCSTNLLNLIKDIKSSFKSSVSFSSTQDFSDFRERMGWSLSGGVN